VFVSLLVLQPSRKELVDFSELELLTFAALVVLCFVTGSFSANSLGFTFLVTLAEGTLFTRLPKFPCDAMLQK